TPVRLGSGAPARIVAGSGRRTRPRRRLPSPRLPPVTSRRTLEVLGALLLLFIARTDVGSAELIFSGATDDRCSVPPHGLPCSPNSTLSGAPDRGQAGRHRILAERGASPCFAIACCSWP